MWCCVRSGGVDGVPFDKGARERAQRTITPVCLCVCVYTGISIMRRPCVAYTQIDTQQQGVLYAYIHAIVHNTNGTPTTDCEAPELYVCMYMYAEGRRRRRRDVVPDWHADALAASTGQRRRRHRSRVVCRRYVVRNHAISANQLSAPHVDTILCHSHAIRTRTCCTTSCCSR